MADNDEKRVDEAHPAPTVEGIEAALAGVQGDDALKPAADAPAAETPSPSDEPEAAGLGTTAPSTAPEAPVSSQALSTAAVNALVDAAETANEMAEAAVQVGESFHGGMRELNEHLGGIQRLNKTIVYAMGAVLFVGLLVFVYMATTLTVRLSRLDATLEAVGTRVVKQAAGLRELEQIREAMGVVAETQRDLLLAQDRLTVSLQDTQSQLEALPIEVPSALEPRIDAAFASGMDLLEGRIQSLGDALGTQEQALGRTSEALGRLSERLVAVDSRSRSLQALQADLGALVTLTRERYLEALQAQLEVGDTGPRLRYPPPALKVGDPAPQNGSLSRAAEEGSP